MREYLLFEYTGCKGLLKNLHQGVKLTGLLTFCILAAALPPAGLLPAAAFIVFLLFNAGRTVIRQFTGLWKLFIFFIVSGLVKGFTGNSALSGVIFTLRLLMMSAAGVLFYSSTRLSSLRPGLKRIFKHIPLTNGRLLADLIIMALAFLPGIFLTINEQRQARYSRLFIPRKNIFRTIKLTTVPLMIEMLIKSDEMADAWYSRGYNPDRK